MSPMSVMSPSMNEQHMTTAEAAKVMGVSARTIRRWLSEDKTAKYIRTPGGQLRVSTATVDAWAHPEAAA